MLLDSRLACVAFSFEINAAKQGCLLSMGSFEKKKWHLQVLLLIPFPVPMPFGTTNSYGCACLQFLHVRASSVDMTQLIDTSD